MNLMEKIIDRKTVKGFILGVTAVGAFMTYHVGANWEKYDVSLTKKIISTIKDHSIVVNAKDLSDCPLAFHGNDEKAKENKDSLFVIVPNQALKLHNILEP